MNSENDRQSASVKSEARPKIIHAAFLAQENCGVIPRIFNEPRRERIARSAELNPVVLTAKNIAQHREEAARTEVIFTGWGLPAEVTTAEYFPALKAVFHSGGSVKGFARPLLERGVQVVGARMANAIAVAHFCLAQIALSCKGYFHNTRMCRDPQRMRAGGGLKGAGIYGEKVALLGLGAVARELLPMVQKLDLKVLAVDPYLTLEEAKTLGVELATMEQAFAQAYVVSNHLPNLTELKGVLNGKLFSSMRTDATFINTGRGAQVDEAEMVEVLRKRPDLTALLDVTDPEPPELNSPLFELENIQLSTHIAGALNDELHRQGDFVLDEFERFAVGKPLLHGDTLETLDRLA